ncbi:macrolide 2'-phosphotransferase [Sutcliffiella sp. NPDC057660]|uniref:macrolide 2'-phosphotransferase n=1 Tax=Sutcliffiella sp. NPDC057660 TaxID=3346199 RepID=UPI003697DFFB
MKLTNNQIIDIAKQNGIDIKRDSLVFNESGLDFLVVFATDINEEKWVLRFPRRKDVMDSTQKEKQTLDVVGDNLCVQAPKWLVYADQLIAYKRLNGVPAGTIDHAAQAYVWELDEKNVPGLFNRTLAEAMVSLHQIDQEKVKMAGLPVETADQARANMAKRMEKVKAEFDVHEELWARWQAWVTEDSLWPKMTGLVHGDLHAGHILIDEDARVTGFIDWTEASVTDTANDFVSHYRTFGEEALKELVKHYKIAGGYVWPNMVQHVIELAAAYPIAIAEFAIKSELDEYKKMAKHVLSVNG